MHMCGSVVSVYDIDSIRMLRAIWGIPVIPVWRVTRRRRGIPSQGTSNGHVTTGTPCLQQRSFEGLETRRQRQRLLALREEVRFNLREERHPDRAMFRPIPPVAVFRRTGTLPFARKEEPTVLATEIALWCLIEGHLSFEADDVGLLPVHAILVRPATIRGDALAVDPLHGGCRVRVARVPDAGRGFVVADQQSRHFTKEIELNRRRLLEFVERE